MQARSDLRAGVFEIAVVARAIKYIHHLGDVEIAQRIEPAREIFAVVFKVAIHLKASVDLVKTIGFNVVASEFILHRAWA